jgi:ATP-dependent Lhr-like helicase
VFAEYDPDNPLLAQATREVLDRQLEAPRLAAAMARLRASRVVMTTPPRPTPFSFPLMVEFFREKLTTEALEARVAKLVAELEASAGV